MNHLLQCIMRRNISTFMLLLTIPFLTFVSFSHADELLDGIAKQLPKSTLSQGQFVQEKHLKFLHKPLVSKGQFVYDINQGILWKTLAPIQSILLLNENQMVSKDSEQTLPAEFSDLFKILLGGDIKRLADQFNVNGTRQSSSWQIDLQPKDGNLKKAFTHLQLKGDNEIRQWELEESNGNLTRILFTDITHPERFSSDQQTEFDALSP